MLRATFTNPHLLQETAEHLPHFPHPTLIIWATHDRVMPPQHGHRLANLIPHAQLIEIDDSYTLIPLDQPTQLAHTIREFTHTPTSAHSALPAGRLTRTHRPPDSPGAAETRP
jgi:pimeloyl-ACP methyl ester carboxylesterase